MTPRRVFFGAQIEAPWPHPLPQGRILPESMRHLTLAFIGNVSEAELATLLKEPLCPPFALGQVACSDALLFLPKKTPHVAALSVRYLIDPCPLALYQRALVQWISSKDFSVEKDPFLPHITLARAPFVAEEWQQISWQLPLLATAIHLYESLGNSRYAPLWSYPLIHPFSELEHTADLAFCIRGSTPQELHLHAKIALVFRFPKFLAFCTDLLHDTLDDIVIDLNAAITRCDALIGCPFKAVSFHGGILQEGPNLLTWEMIVDV